MNTLYRSDFAKQIKTLHVDTGHSVGYFDYGIAHLGDDGLPNLERLQVHSYSNAYFKNSVERAALMPREIPTLALMGTIKTLEDRAFESLVAVEVPQCHTLDLASLSMVLRSGWHYILGIEDADEEPSYKQGRTMVLDAFRNQFASHFKDSPLARSISAVRLGALLYSDEFAERLSDAGVEVTQ